MTHPVLDAADAIDVALKSVADVNPTFMSPGDKAAALGIDIYTLNTSRPMELALYDFVQSRARRASQPLRAGGVRA